MKRLGPEKLISDPVGLKRFSWRLVKRQLLCGAVYYTGFLSLWRLWPNGGNRLILSYHEIFGDGDNISWCNLPSLLVSKELFQEQLELFTRHYKIVSLDEIALSQSKNVAAITFDDGYRGVYRRAFPILKAMGVPATVFLVTDYLGTAMLPWWERLIDQITKFLSLPRKERSRLLRMLNQNWRLVFDGNANPVSIFYLYKNASKIERSQLEKMLTKAAESPKEHNDRIFLSEAEVQEMKEANISFGAHTKSHPTLPWIDRESLTEELKGSKKVIQNLTGSSNCWFAYPDGMFTAREEKAVENLGFVGAVQTSRRPDKSGLFSLPRVDVSRMSTANASGRLSRAMTEVTLAEFNKERLRMTVWSFLNRKRLSQQEL